MSIANYFPVFSKLTPQQQIVLDYTAIRTVPAGTVVHNGAVECTGFLPVRSGQLQAYMLSEGLVQLSRGTIEIIDEAGLESLQDG